MPRFIAFGLAAALCAGLAAPALALAAKPVALPGPHYEVLGSGPEGGAHPTRADTVAIRYVGRLTDGSIFSTSDKDGAEATRFPVKGVIPGFSAIVQLMRPGDHWRMILPGYLAYGAQGRRYGPAETTLKRDVPPDSTLIFDVELISITPTP